MQPTVFPDGWETLGIIQDHVLLLLLCSKTGTQTLSPFRLKHPIKHQDLHCAGPSGSERQGGAGGAGGAGRDLIIAFVIIVSFIVKLAGFVLLA